MVIKSFFKKIFFGIWYKYKIGVLETFFYQRTDEELKNKGEFLKQPVRWLIDAPDESIIFSEIDRLADLRGRRIRKTELSRYVVTCIHDEILRGKELIKNG